MHLFRVFNLWGRPYHVICTFIGTIRKYLFIYGSRQLKRVPRQLIGIRGSFFLPCIFSATSSLFRPISIVLIKPFHKLYLFFIWRHTFSSKDFYRSLFFRFILFINPLFISWTTHFNYSPCFNYSQCLPIGPAPQISTFFPSETPARLKHIFTLFSNKQKKCVVAKPIKGVESLRTTKKKQTIKNIKVKQLAKKEKKRYLSI